ncbi:predicted protein [Naegleria gruberi]|uniref:Predicted protein n=1 Tax=Naegleria gruberi TaxID=5762 RepID=D2VZ22_NAEGR|nr:uncharacterized protein NAEGRDRAFT_74327 [Naegleria gruberi]EFC37869.1 predicted protein [Naegleria gruberi]|eukprot:XP_002670613.1 predicted protein [Naegleria gruberi strain NEG-M]
MSQPEGQQNDDAKNLFNLGTKYEREGDYVKAMEWYLKAAEKGHAAAHYNIAGFYHEGMGVKQDYSKAMEWNLKAAEKGDKFALFNIGYMYSNGEGVKKNYAKAMEWYLKADEHNSADAQHNIAQFYYYGQGVQKDNAKAMEWYLKSAGNGTSGVSSAAKYNIGSMYANGEGVPCDMSKAFRWFSTAAKEGHAGAQCALEYLLDNFEDLDDEDEEEFGMENILELARQGDANAQYEVADLFLNGMQSEYQALEWYLKAAKQDHAPAQYEVGNCYFFGRGTSKDLSSALEWFLKSADQEYPKALLMMGYLFENGVEVEKNFEKALEYYKKAAEKGDNQVKFTLALMYSEGKGTTASMMDSLKWLLDSYKESMLSKSVVQFLQYFNLVTVSGIENRKDKKFITQLYDDFISKSICDVCEEDCEGFYYATGSDRNSFDVCQKCWKKTKILKEFKDEIGDRKFKETHYLAHFLPLIMFCKEKEGVSNKQLDTIIAELKKCVM